MWLKKLRFYVFFIFVFSFGVSVFAQKQDEFRSEIGFHVGGSGLLGDQLFDKMQLSYGLDYRYKFNNRFALKAELMRSRVYSEFVDFETYKETGFNNGMVGFDITGEFNFFEFDTDPYNRKARQFTPYIFAGVGLLGYTYDEANTVTPVIPFGLGFKIKLAPRLNLNLQYTQRLSFVDNLEGVPELSDINNVKGSNFMNKDMLSVFSIGLTFDFWKRTGNCYCP